MKKSILFGLILIVSTTLILLGFANAKGNGVQTAANITTTASTVFINNINETNGKTSLTADEIQWYEGEAANKQFRQHEKDAEVQEAPDGYYIVNDKINLQLLPISSNVQVFMQIYDRPGEGEPELIPNESISLKQFKALFNQMDRLDLRDYPFHLTIKNGEVIKIVQQFIP
jgi:hypothetical protein